jgi:hypothetical protein
MQEPGRNNTVNGQERNLYPRWLGALGCAMLISLALVPPVWGDDSPGTPKDAPSAWQQVERVGPPTLYSPSAEHYRFGAYGPALVSDPDFYPIPQDLVTRETYMQFMNREDLTFADRVGVE